MIRMLTYIHPHTLETVSTDQVRSKLRELGRKQFIEQQALTVTRELELDYPLQTRSARAQGLASQLKEGNYRLFPA